VAAAALAGQPLVLAGIDGYQRTIAPIVAHVTGPCRFTPSCSVYAEAVIARDGLARGGWKAVRRIAKCGPWTARGTRDEP
jgi:putative membrane protein insertion efficiency factor